MRKKGKRKTVRRWSRPRAASAKPRRHRRGGGKIALSSVGVQRAFALKAVALGLLGAVGARALYGLVVDKAPDLDDKIRCAIAAVGPGLAGIAASGAPGVVVPLAIGGASMALADLLADQIAEAAGDSVPEAVKDGITLGVGYAGKEAALPPVDPLLSEAAAAAALQVSPPPVQQDYTETGVGSIEMLRLV